MTAALARLCATEALFEYLRAHHVAPLSYCQFLRACE